MRRVWQAMAGCGRLWQAVAGCGRLNTDAYGFSWGTLVDATACRTSYNLFALSQPATVYWYLSARTGVFRAQLPGCNLELGIFFGPCNWPKPCIDAVRVQIPQKLGSTEIQPNLKISRKLWNRMAEPSSMALRNLLGPLEDTFRTPWYIPCGDFLQGPK